MESSLCLALGRVRLGLSGWNRKGGSRVVTSSQGEEVGCALESDILGPLLPVLMVLRFHIGKNNSWEPLGSPEVFAAQLLTNKSKTFTVSWVV